MKQTKACILLNNLCWDFVTVYVAIGGEIHFKVSEMARGLGFEMRMRINCVLEWRFGLSNLTEQHFIKRTQRLWISIALFPQDLLAQGKANASSSANDEVDLDELMDVSEPCILILLLSSSVYISSFFHVSTTHRTLSWRNCMLTGLQLLRYLSRWCSFLLSMKIICLGSQMR